MMAAWLSPSPTTASVSIPAIPRSGHAGWASPRWRNGRTSWAGSCGSIPRRKRGPAYLLRCRLAESIRVLIVDDHPVVRQGLRAFLEARNGVEVVGEAGDGAEALRIIGQAAPDVVLMDLVMPGM